MNSIRSVTEGAILTALYSIFLLAFLYLPVIGSLFIFILPVPFIIYVTRHTLKNGLLLLAVALLITYMIGSVVVLPITMMFGMTGLIMGYTYSLRKSAYAILISGSLSFIVNFVLLFIITNVFLKINFVEDTKNMMRQSIQTAEKMVTSLGQPTDQIELMYEIIDLISYIVPSAIVLTSIFLALITQFFGNQLLKRFKYDFQSFPPLRQWTFPKSLLWYYLIVLILFMIGTEEGTILYTISINLYIVLEIIMIIQGFSFIFFYFFTQGKSLMVPVIILIVSIFIPLLLNLIRILGIIDLGFNLRRRLKNPQ